jgi:hypothetical protein
MAIAQPTNIESTDNAKPQDDWLKRVKSAWQVSDSYYTANLEQRIVKNQLLFDSKHPPGSKYHTDAYRFRSKLFRPKIRSAGRKTEAAGVQAFFSTIDCIDISAEDQNNPQAMIAAELTGALLKHHLNNTIPWFQTCIGGLQDAFKTGVVCSFNHWKKSTSRYTVKVPAFGPDEQQLLDEKGKPIYNDEKREDILEDRPDVELFPFSQLRFHPAAKWIDPMNTSPFVARIMPMYVCDIKARMREQTPDSSRWHKLDDDAIVRAKLKKNEDADAQARNQNRQNPDDVQTPGVKDYDISYVLHWFMIDPNDGRRYEFYTLGTDEKLTEPKLLKATYPHGKVPITYGCFFLEAHKVVPTSGPELGEGLNKEANNISNSRLDNIQLVLNKRYIVRRGRQVDVRSLVMNAPASVTFATDPTSDVVPLEFNDITGSSYEEQSRIDNDSDELLGNFSQSSIQSNRAMNDTVGGMQLLHGSSGQLTDYGLKTFVETWMEPTLRQLLSLIQFYESDTKRITKAASSAGMMEKFAPVDAQGQPMPGPDGKPAQFQPTEEMMEGDVKLTVNVGVGASNPVFKAQQFIMAVKQLAEVAVALKQGQITGVQMQEIAKELFGYIGYKDGSRFFKLDEEGAPDPQVQEMQAELQRLTQVIESKQVEQEGAKAIKALEMAQKTGSERKQREHEWNTGVAERANKLKLKLIDAKIAKEKIASAEKVAKDDNQAAVAAAKAKPKSNGSAARA